MNKTKSEPKMNKTELTNIKRKQVAVLLGGKCILCLKSFGKNFHFHHVEYREGEKKHSDFKSWISYTEYIIPIIQKIPDKFALLCNTCHRLISILQSIKDNARFERVVDLSRRSR